MRILLFAFLLFLTTACEKPPESKEAPKLTIEKSRYSDLPSWKTDDLAQTIPAFKKSCKRIMRRSADRPFGALEASGTYGDWQPLCKKFVDLADKTTQALRKFFEANFTPYAILADDQPEGLFTGYYEASLKGALMKYGPYKYPLYSRPNDLVMVNLGEFREDLKGRRIAGRVKGGQLKPYEDRTAIVAGDWPHNSKTLLWVDDPVDAFFVQIQGSGLITLDNNQLIRIGYAGQNGHPYYAIGRELIKRGHIAKEDMSMQAIRAWLSANPEQADEIMNTNASYVFFRKLKGDGPLGGEGVSLTAGRSLAIDRSLISYGIPLFVDLSPVIEGEEGAEPIQRLMIAQDTGGAIRGPVRGDVFWGNGKHAEHMAGHMKSTGRYWALLPNSLEDKEPKED